MPPKCPILLLGLLGLGCGAEPEIELPPVLEESDHLVLRGYEDVCEGTFEEMEARVLAVQELFHAPASQVAYNWMGDEYPAAGCPERSVGCVRGQDIFAEHLAIEHELIHARSSLLPVVLEEGLSTFLGGNRMALGTREALRSAIENDEGLAYEFSYSRASEFVQFLVQIGGFEKLRELDERTDYVGEFAEWRPQLEAIYGQTWEGIWAAYLESPACYSYSMHDDVYLCYVDDAPVIEAPAGATEFEYVHDMECGAPGVVGPLSGGKLRHEIAIDFGPVSESWFVGVSGNLVPGSRIRLTRCGPCDPEDGLEITGTSQLYWTVAPLQGRYVLEFIQPADAGGQLGIDFGT